MKFYKYDIAISLCKQDVGFARQLCKALNPRLKIFFYEDRQEELINKNGAEAFGKVFRDDARVIVILSRNEWSESYYTDIERNAIIDRTSVKNEGYQSLLVIPIEPGQIPSWYPSTRIYVDPRNFTIEQIARIIEFKVTELDGVVKPVTFEEKLKNLQAALENKKEEIRYLISRESLGEADVEAKKIPVLFNQKVDMVQQAGLPFALTFRKFPPLFRYAVRPTIGRVGIEGVYLQIAYVIDWERDGHATTSQFFLLHFMLYRAATDDPTVGNVQKIAEKRYRFNKTNEYNIGWAEEVRYSNSGNERILDFMFRDPMDRFFYELKGITSTEALMEEWFTELHKQVEMDFRKIIQ